METHREKHTAELNLTEARDTQLNIMHISGSQKQEVSTLRQTDSDTKLTSVNRHD